MYVEISFMSNLAAKMTYQLSNGFPKIFLDLQQPMRLVPITTYMRLDLVQARCTLYNIT